MMRIFVFAALLIASFSAYAWPISQCKSGNPLWIGLNTYKGPSGETARIHDVIEKNAIEFNNVLTVAVWFGDDDVIAKSLRDQSLVKKYGAQSLYVAASMGRLHEMSMLIDSGVSPNAEINNGFTPIYGAAKSGCVRAMRALVAYGADLSHKTSVRWTLLEVAVVSKQFGSAQFLMEHGYKVEADEKDRIKKTLERMGMASEFERLFGSERR